MKNVVGFDALPTKKFEWEKPIELRIDRLFLIKS